jgi:TPP-dependent pyruvate/acetoin dehydrogenase alpha subunit
MSEMKTASMLQRVPVILAVTANSYGLSPHPEARKSATAGDRHRHARRKGAHDGKPMAHR